MKSLTATEAKNSFGMLLDWARQEPVLIEKQGRKVAVMLSVEEYQRLSSPPNQSANLDNKDLTLAERLAILKLPPEERAKILRESAEKMLFHYQENQEWQDLSGGDFIDY
ncbi:type II toxin-antitoxin system Phd/YefM family antitoxin [Cyanobacterium sp. Dongsha4]|uniref:type II toxin-antitoxin system Phd/YefM family antitoxin n=1 Tax=Cyanobacterium sp. DS4 TaxID=2878255 RepID=UPI002E821EC4|nr:type II toxin-antitoxin system Phd/YefM family antitoxin [Cyanobacterium sp. Dongsha4]WVL02335.1 type II toxin-antitoxin system prevent-host-death family antitoxin [Cyanobacterium sp. Dongsha4]